MSETLAMLSKYNQLIWDGTLETLYMVGISLSIAVLFGVTLGVLTVITRSGHILPNKYSLLMN